MRTTHLVDRDLLWLFNGEPPMFAVDAGNLATLRAAGVDARVLAQPEVMAPTARDKFTVEGELHDETTRTFIAKHLVALEPWTRRLTPAAT